MPKVRCVKAPVLNKTQGISLYAVGQEADVSDFNRWWKDQLKAGTIVVLKPKVEKPVVKPDAPEVGVLYKLGRTVAEVAKITEKMVCCVARGGKKDGKEFKVRLDKWAGVKTEKKSE